MVTKEMNDYFYVCALIEYIARQTTNRRGVVVEAIGREGLAKLVDYADVNHCLQFEQVSDEVVAQYNISSGDFDTISNCRYAIPSYTDIGRLYTYIIFALAPTTDKLDTLINVFQSFLSDEISRFATALYCENPSYLCESFKAGRLLEM